MLPFFNAIIATLLPCHRRSIMLFLLFFFLIIPGYSQESVLGNVKDLYNSFQVTRSNARVSAALPIKTGGGKSLNITMKEYNQTMNGELFVGKVVTSKTSQVFFTFKDGEVSGKIIVPQEKKAYTYSSKNGLVSVVLEDVNNLICVEYETEEAFSAPSGSSLAPASNSNVYNLQSLPGATAVVMLDFDGHNTAGSWWGNITAQPSNVSEAAIIDAWHVVSDDFRPFNLNITTNEAIYQAAPVNSRMRVILTPTTTAYPGSGGVAFIGSFPYGGDVAPCWVFNLGDGKLIGETASHEIGHTMGLGHDGRTLATGNEEYYEGAGNWAPIMGVSYYKEVSHWSKGQYQYANNFEEDIAIIASTSNGFGFREKLMGHSFATAIPLVVNNGQVSAVSNHGVIRSDYDRDFYSITTTGGQINLVVAPATYFPNLDIAVQLNNVDGSLITASNPEGLANGIITRNLSAGTYYLSVVGVGEGNSFNGGGYTAYSSIGAYTISGTVPNDDTTGSTICNDYIQQLNNGNVYLSVTFPVEKAYVEVFATKNDQQHLATNIKASQVVNADGTYTYNYAVPASFYATGDKIQTRFYSYAANGPGEFTPGGSSNVWSKAFYYNETDCDEVTPPSTCDDYIQQLSNGDIKFMATFPQQQAFVEVFARKNGQQNIATNISGSQVSNPNGSYSYSLVVPALSYNSGDAIDARFYSYAPASPGVFTPGPTQGNWTESFIFGQSVCQTCEDVNEPNMEWQNATSISVNKTISAKVDSYIDRDWFTFTTSNESPYFQVSLTNLDADLDISLYDAGFTFVRSSLNSSNQDELITYNGTGSETYFVQVYGYNNQFSNQCYELRVSTSGNPIAFREGASSIDNKNKTSEGTMQLYPNPIRSGNTLTVVINVQNNNETVNFRIVDLKGMLVSEQSVALAEGQATLSLGGIIPGVYVLEADGLNKQKLIIE